MNFLYNMIKYRHNITNYHRRGGVEVERSTSMQEIGVRSPVATDP